jgi:cobalt/nickel transport system permease protein
MDWLFKEDDYIPAKDKKEFIDKSIFSILGVLSKVRQEDKSNGGIVYKLSPPVKFICTFLMILAIALSRNVYFVLFADSYFLLMLSLLLLKDIRKIVTITFIVFLFSIVLLLPSMFFGNFNNSILISLKIIGTVLSLNILSYTTKWQHITRSLKIFFIPDIFILILDMTLKYIVIFGDFSVNMLYALRARSVGKDNEKHTSLSGLVGTLFLKSKEMAEDTYHAMYCRGFTGEYKSKLHFKIKFADIVFIFMNIIILSLFFFIGKGRF